MYVPQCSNGAQLYYSPKALKAITGTDTPNRDMSKLEEGKVKGCENDDFKVYKYK